MTFNIVVPDSADLMIVLALFVVCILALIRFLCVLRDHSKLRVEAHIALGEERRDEMREVRARIRELELRAGIYKGEG